MSHQTLPIIQIFDTMSGKKSALETVTPGVVRMYVCGLTVYDLAHIGHARTFILFDVIRRYLTHRGYRVEFVRNHTDVDDRIIARANERGEDHDELAQRFIDALDEDMGRLGCIAPDVAPRVTHEIDTIIAMIERLVERGHAYEEGGDVFFEVSTFRDYGKLSKCVLEEQRTGDRVQVDLRKRSLNDFVLWKAAKPGEPKWDSPWGEGRPGWHIECSAMSCKHLGDTFDIHGGGRDLVFPHHENEIAQAEGATGKPFVRYWMHAGPLTIGGEKMSKSLNNFWTLRDVLEVHHPDTIRFFMLTAQYRKPVAYSEEGLDDARARVTYFYKTLQRLDTVLELSDEVESDGPVLEADLLGRFWEDVHTAMDNDFNMPKYLALLTELAKVANDVLPARDKALKDPKLARTAARLRTLIAEAGQMAGLFEPSPTEALLTIRNLRVKQRGLSVEEIEGLIAARTKARADKEWQRADEVRNQLVDMGISLMDGSDGTQWEAV